MPAIARITTFGRNYLRDRDRLVECLRNGDPFYMASTTGGPVTPDMHPSMGQLNRERSSSLRVAVGAGLIDYIVWSYETPIAWRTTNGGSAWRWVMDDARYSRTTSIHQSMIRRAIETLEG